MSNIWILGDSWGTHKGYAEYVRNDQKHLHHFLVANGHTVKNFSMPGAGNGASINQALPYINKNVKIDYLIWFHTESLRDREHGMLDNPFKIDDLTRKNAQAIYAAWKQFVLTTEAKDIIIGGQAPIIEDLLMHRPYHLIKDWRSELLGIPSILTHSVCHPDLFEHPNCIDSHEYRFSMLKENERIVDMMFQSKLFPDNAHPGTQAHKELFDRIKSLIK